MPVKTTINFPFWDVPSSGISYVWKPLTLCPARCASKPSFGIRLVRKFNGFLTETAATVIPRLQPAVESRVSLGKLMVSMADYSIADEELVAPERRSV